MRDEESRVLSVKSLGDKVMNRTSQNGRISIRSTIEEIQKEWAILVSNLDNSIEQIQSKIHSWEEYDRLKDQCSTWMRSADSELHSINLKATAEEKKEQLDRLIHLQGEIRAKELEIDQLTEKAQQLTKGVNKRNSQIPEIESKYHQISQKVKDTTTKWQQFVISHQDLESTILQLEEWLQSLGDKLTNCENIKNATQKDIEKKITIIQTIFLVKEEGFQKIQSVVELAQTVLANTASNGHPTINDKVSKLQEEWSAIASRMIETKNLLDNALTKWTGISQEIQDLSKVIEMLKVQIVEHSVYCGTMTEKKNQLDSIKKVEEKARCEKNEVDNLKQLASTIFARQQGEEITKCQNILDEFDDCVQKIQVSSILENLID